MTTYIGFDSAWTDSSKHPGAICVVQKDGVSGSLLVPPTLATFKQALEHVQHWQATDSLTLVAIDQPTIVNNLIGCRPVERVAGSVLSWMGGGVQPSNRSKLGMFCDQSPIWSFLKTMNAVEDPPSVRFADHGLFIMEVFPALALATLEPGSFRRNGALKYNPQSKKKFSMCSWKKVAFAAAAEASRFRLEGLAEWCEIAATISAPKKADQDRLDAALCALIAVRWKEGTPEESLLLGDIQSGYMVSPTSEAVRSRLYPKAKEHGVRIDGVLL